MHDAVLLEVNGPAGHLVLNRPAQKAGDRPGSPGFALVPGSPLSSWWISRSLPTMRFSHSQDALVTGQAMWRLALDSLGGRSSLPGAMWDTPIGANLRLGPDEFNFLASIEKRAPMMRWQTETDTSRSNASRGPVTLTPPLSS
jgi:hypothetical protein